MEEILKPEVNEFKGFVRIEEIDFIANALIEMKEKYGLNNINQKQLDAYKAAVLYYMRKSGIPAMAASVDKFYFENKRSDFQEYFSMFYKDGEGMVYIINQGVTTSMLWSKFRNYISVRCLKIFWSEECYKYLENPEDVVKLKREI